MSGLDELRALAEGATPGPWVVGWWTGQLPDNKFHDCAAKGALLGWLPGGYHVHERDFMADGHHLSRGVEPFTEVSGNYDYEEGGIIHAADAAYIAALDPTTVLALLDVCDAAARYWVARDRDGWDSGWDEADEMRAALARLEGP